MRLKSDLVGLLDKALDGALDAVQPEWDQRAALGVVMAAGGYPESYEKGDVITGLEETGDPALKTFHAGTRTDDGRIVTNGGRVLCVVGLGETVAAARDKAYQGVAHIDWRNCYFRRDIGHRALSRG
jgi:phosphoribosylamine--glycine ligase